MKPANNGNKKPKIDKNFVNPNKTLNFASQRGPDGGIGRRAGLKHQWGNPCRFDPGSGYEINSVKY